MQSILRNGHRTLVFICRNVDVAQTERALFSRQGADGPAITGNSCSCRMMDVRTRFGRNMRRLRKAKGMSQERFALEFDIDRSYVSGIERGKRNPTIPWRSDLPTRWRCRSPICSVIPQTEPRTSKAAYGLRAADVASYPA
ncbi:helix-turn-helix domain-containing protein [Sphingomonas sp. Leaf357]|uniref:helix-turn-helix domain-containing protein n=1 Tax=Sphingomonas sp. Leaf357 TaxID=1736350 RepID=UPI001F166430|nr:helix-turn-helix transcriptional regulator [Sphingomonas sp. Leaf357]